MEVDRTLTEVELALLDTFKLVFEVFVAKGIARSDVLAEALKRQADQYPAKTMPAAKWAIECLREVLLDQHRTALRELLSRPPEGNA